MDTSLPAIPRCLVEVLVMMLRWDLTQIGFWHIRTPEFDTDGAITTRDMGDFDRCCEIQADTIHHLCRHVLGHSDIGTQDTFLCCRQT